ncbi:MAG: ATP synthase subunit C [Oscillospiraceae bacterium]|nr:ATP synthase subunit C [Oscillospiraceae bacterium]
MKVMIFAALILMFSMIALGVRANRKGMGRSAAKRLFGANVAIFFGLMLVTTIVLMSGVGAGSVAAAAGAEAAGPGAAAATGGNSSYGLAYIAAALSTGLATIGAGIAVANTGSAALGAISEDQSLLGKSLIFVGLAEGIAIYGLIVSMMILGYVG